MLIFIGVLVAALVYLWRLGALEWGTKKAAMGMKLRDEGREMKEEG
jgi:hypothetical protein